VHDEALFRPGEDPEQAPVLLGVRDAEVGERLRRTGSTALRLLPAALRRGHFVRHLYIVPHGTDKTGLLPSPPRPPEGHLQRLDEPRLEHNRAATGVIAGIESLPGSRRLAQLPGLSFDLGGAYDRAFPQIAAARRGRGGGGVGGDVAGHA
jgi:hypothetical protein